MADDPGTVENKEREAREPAHMNLVGGQVSDGTDRIVVGELHVHQLRISIVLAFVDDHSQHLGHCVVNVVNAFHTTVAAGMVGAGGEFSNTKKLMYDVGKLGEEPEADVREDARWTPPMGNVPVDKDDYRAFSCKFSGGDGEHVRTTAKAVGKRQNIGVTPGRDRQWPRIVHAYRNARSRRGRNRNDGSSNRQSWCLPHLALQAMAQPIAGAYAHS